MSRTRFALAAALVAAAPLSAQTVFHEVTGTHAEEWFGNSVANVGDVNQDGVADFAAGAPESFYAAAPGPGAVHVYSGLDRSLLYTLSGDSPGDTFGESLTGLGDVSGDGIPDFAAGGTQYVQPVNTGLGYVRVFSGADGSQLHEFVGTGLDEAFGGYLSCPGDVDADGTPDLLISAYWAPLNGATDVGAVHVYSGATFKLIGTLWGSGQDASFGFSTDGIGDIDADGFDDFVVGAPNDIENGVQSGTVQVFSGANLKLLYRFGLPVHGVFGITVAGGGDVNADGIPDFAGADTQDLSGSNQFSRVIVWSGADGSVLRQFGGQLIFDGFGYGLTIDLDVDGDGWDDVAIGAPAQPDANGGIPGVMRVYSGRTSALLLEKEGPVPTSFIGYGLVADAMGDLNGDGKDELLVGAPYLDEFGGIEVGLVHVLSAADFPASWQNYGAGWPGTLCTPNLTASAPPVIGTTIQFLLENSRGADTYALFFGGVAKASLLTNKGGTLLVAPPWLILPVSLPAAGLALDIEVPLDVTLLGLEYNVQALELDPGASKGISFTPGLELILGG